MRLRHFIISKYFYLQSINQTIYLENKDEKSADTQDEWDKGARIIILII